MCKNKIEEAALSVQGVKTAKWSSTNEKLKLKFTNSSINQPKELVKKYCSVFTPNEKIEF